MKKCLNPRGFEGNLLKVIENPPVPIPPASCNTFRLLALWSSSLAASLSPTDLGQTENQTN